MSTSSDVLKKITGVDIWIWLLQIKLREKNGNSIYHYNYFI